ncbi:SAM domain and HD [Entophlyctis sp. JEL0112]|nr:SAM domain and HD [Entophlyctis sp. JEL0112]
MSTEIAATEAEAPLALVERMLRKSVTVPLLPAVSYPRPRVVLTFAQSLDGCIGAKDNSAPLLLSGQQSMAVTHALRQSLDAILVGAGTAVNDNPRLAVNPSLLNLDSSAVKHPRPVILDTRLRIRIDANIVKLKNRPIVFCNYSPAHKDYESISAKRKLLEEQDVTVVNLWNDSEFNSDDQLQHSPRSSEIHLPTMLRVLKQKFGIESVMVEGGAMIISRFLALGSSCVDDVVITIAPILVGDGIRAYSGVGGLVQLEPVESAGIKAMQSTYPHYQYEKKVMDPIHGQMCIDGYCWAIIDTPQFQRLRDLKQLGSAYFVFPGASHNRFEHSLGVSHLSNNLITQLQRTQPELGIDDFDIKCVTLAGLAHDLGHGPFSHVFDAHVIPKLRPDIKWTHEQASETMLEHLVNSNGLTVDQCSEDEIKFIKGLIRGFGNSNSSEKAFLYDIVNNKRNSVDVDKFDYISRDSKYLGMKTCGFDHQRSMQYTRVIDNQICWSKNEAYNLCQVQLIQANTVDCPDEYTYLTDGIIREIERSRVPELNEARAILKRIRLRDLYRCADSYLLPKEYIKLLPKENFTTVAVLAYANESERKLIRDEDVLTEYLELNWCLGAVNPVERCGFFTKFEPNKRFPIGRADISHCLPQVPQEITLRIFVKRDTLRKPVQDIFRRYVNDISKWNSSSKELSQGSEFGANTAAVNSGTEFSQDAIIFTSQAPTRRESAGSDGSDATASNITTPVRMNGRASVRGPDACAMRLSDGLAGKRLRSPGVQSVMNRGLDVVAMETWSNSSGDVASVIKRSRSGESSDLEAFDVKEVEDSNANIVKDGRPPGISPGNNLPDDYGEWRDMSPQKQRKKKENA